MSDQHKKPLRVRESEALSGELPVPGGRSMFRILLDEESSGRQAVRLAHQRIRPGAHLHRP